MAQSREHKAQTRERILAQASERLRTDGLSGVSIAQLMTAAGVTHGGFYRHFESRDDLIAQATSRALQEGAAAGARARAGQPPTLSAYIRGYLSRTHRDFPGNGCAIAALAADVPHAGASTAAVFTTGLKSALGRLSGQYCALQSAAQASGRVEPLAENKPPAGAGSQTRQMPRQTQNVAPNESGHDENLDEAIALLSTMVGALVLARAVDDPVLSDLILAVNRRRLLADLA